MRRYYVNKNAQPDGYHEVHESSCKKLPLEENRKYLGLFEDSKDAVKKAKEQYDKVDGCYYCCRNSHTR